MYNAITKGHEIVALGHLTPANDELDIDSYMYQTICSNLIPSIAKCLGFPLFIQKIMGSSLNTHSLDYVHDAADEVEDLYSLVSNVEAEIKIEGVITGAICSEYQKRRVNNVCQRLNLDTCHPLWMRDQAQLLDEMIKSGQRSIVVKTSSMGLNKQHLGKSINELQSHFMELVV